MEILKQKMLILTWQRHGSYQLNLEKANAEQNLVTYPVFVNKDDDSCGKLTEED